MTQAQGPVDGNMLHYLTYGMYVVSSFRDERLNGQIANTLFQAASEPKLVAVSINKSNLTHEFIAASGYFCASVLAEEAPMTFIGKFGFRTGRDLDKFRDTAFKKLASGCPAVLEYCLGYLEAKVCGRQDCGEHTLFIAEVTGMEKTGEGKPMTYDFYHEIKKGKTPQAAPTFERKAG